MKRFLAYGLAIAMVTLLAGCSGGGKSADPPASIQVTAGETSVVVTFPMSQGVDYWLFYAPSPELTSTNFTSVPGGRVIVNAVSPVVIPGLANGTPYYFTINGRTDHGPGGTGTPLVSATPRAAGNAWNLGSSLIATELRGAAFGAVFVAVGANGAMFSTLDGASWTPINYVATTDLNAVFYGIGGYFAVGAGGVVLQSADAATWTPVNSGTTSTLYAGAFNGAIDLAVGANGTYVASGDGQTWGAAGTGTSSDLYGLAVGAGRWVAVGAGGTIVTSTDSATWQAAASNTQADLKAVTYSTAAATFVAVGAGGAVVTSPDGVNWTARAPISAATLTGVGYGSQFVAVGGGGSIYTSADGVTWQPAASGTASNLNAVAFGNFRFVTVGTAGTNLHAN